MSGRTPPKHLTPTAKEFWKRIHPHIADRLTEADLPNFELLSLNWNIIRTLDPLQNPKQGLLFMAAQKHFLNLSKQFGLTPDARRKVAPPQAKSIEDVLGDVMGPKESRAEPSA